VSINAKAKGTRNEHRSMAYYERQGYLTMRSAASLSPWDFIAWTETDIIYCQVRSSRWPGSKEMEILQETMIPAWGRKVVHRWMPRKREPDIKGV
jgi:hypothetical protein